MAEKIQTKNNSEKINTANNYNRKNVNNIKKMILIVLLMMFLLPIMFCLFLMVKMNKLEKKVDDLVIMMENGQGSLAVDDNSELLECVDDELKFLDQVAYSDIAINTTEENAYLTNPEEVSTATDTAFKEEETYKNGKKVYLTFDDGPSENTGRLLEILKEKNVKATFFVCYNPDKKVWPYYKQIVDEGHTLGMHSYSHIYSEIYADKESFVEDVTLIHDFLYEQTGINCTYYRFPGGSSNTVSDVDIQELIDFLKDNNIEYYDWNSMSGDAANDRLSSDELNANVLKYVRSNEGDSIVLMHDLTSIPETVEGLVDLIDTLKEEGYELCPIDKKTEPVQHVKYEEDTAGGVAIER